MDGIGEGEPLTPREAADRLDVAHFMTPLHHVRGLVAALQDHARPTRGLVTDSDGWRDRVEWARGVLGRFLDDSPLAREVGQDVRTAIVTLTSDAHVRYAPKYPQPVDGSPPVPASEVPS